jgi:N-methylhydantoinase A
VTDADTALGRLDPARFAGGSVPLHPEKAARALPRHWPGCAHRRRRGRPRLSMRPPVAGAGAGPRGGERQGRGGSHAGSPSAVRRRCTRRGWRASWACGAWWCRWAPGRRQRLLAFLRAPIAYAVVRTRHMRLEALDVPVLNALFAQMRAEAEAVVRLGAPTEALRGDAQRLSCATRGQGHADCRRAAQPRLRQADGPAPRFTRCSTPPTPRCSAAPFRRLEVEALTWTLSLATDRPLPNRRAAPPALPAPPPLGWRAVLDPALGTAEPAALFERPSLKPGMRFAGAGAGGGGRDHPPWCRAASTRIVNGLGQLILEDAPVTEARFADIRLQVMSNRLLSVVEEQARRAGAHRLLHLRARGGRISAAGVFDLDGQMLAQGGQPARPGA